MKYIFTADDFGVSPIIDDAIGEAVSKGCINSVADLANGFDTKGFSAVLQLKKLKEAHPHIQVGRFQVVILRYLIFYAIRVSLTGVNLLQRLI